LISTLLGISIGFILFIAYPILEPAIWRSTRTSRLIHKSLSNKWWIDAIYARAIVWPTFGLGLFGSKLVDRGIIELIGPGGITNIFSQDYSPFKASTNNIPLYALYTALFALLSITFLQISVSINWISDFNYLIVLSLATYYTLVRSSINTTTLRKSTPFSQSYFSLF
jgi:NADH-ubiquinone oxidoreductase chain 5